MSRPRSAALTAALAAIASGELYPAEAARRYGISRSAISRALKRTICECCGQAIPVKSDQFSYPENAPSAALAGDIPK